MTLPNFLIVGAAKSATTSLWQNLRQHPEIYMHPRKQLNFYAFEGQEPRFRGPAPLDESRYDIRTIEQYETAFAGAGRERVVGEASNLYLYSPTAAERIRKHAPDTKIIAVLRHPAERAYSRFLQLVLSGRESITDFARALREEEARVAEGWWPEFHYLRAGLYDQQLSRYRDHFPDEQIRVYLYEELSEDMPSVLVEIFDFLGVERDFEPDADIRYSASGIPAKKTVHWSLQRLRSIRPLAERLLPKACTDGLARRFSEIHRKNLAKPKMSAEARALLLAGYHDDTRRLEKRINRDLSAWLQ